MKADFAQFGLSVRKHSSWNVVITFSSLVLFTTLLLIFVFPLATSGFLRALQWFHIVLALGGIILAIKRRHTWNIHLAVVAFIVLYSPYFFLTWLQHVIFIENAQYFSPFVAIKLHFFALAFLVPGPFWINLSMMLLFALEAMAMWWLYDIPHLPKVIMGFEPVTTLLFGIVSLFLLFFRYRDEKVIRELSRKYAEAEAYEKIAKIFLNIRDRTNTPIQTLKLATFILKNRHPEDNDLIPIMEKCIAKLTELNEILNQTEAQINWQNSDIMTDQDIKGLMSELDQMKGNRHTNST